MLSALYARTAQGASQSHGGKDRVVCAYDSRKIKELGGWRRHL